MRMLQPVSNLRAGKAPPPKLKKPVEEPAEVVEELSEVAEAIQEAQEEMEEALRNEATRAGPFSNRILSTLSKGRVAAIRDGVARTQ